MKKFQHNRVTAFREPLRTYETLKETRKVSKSKSHYPLFFAYLWSIRWPNYNITLQRYFSFRLPHLNIPNGPPSDELDKNSQRTWPLPYFKINIYPFPLPHFASIFFAYLWSFRWPNYIVTLPRCFSFRLPHLNIPSIYLLNETGACEWYAPTA
jgi:hypothetical protein